MKPLFLGSHCAIDFLNTTLAPQGTVLELIGDGASFVDWLVQAGLLDTAEAATVHRRFSNKALNAIALEARQLRAWATQWIARWRESPNGTYSVELQHLNALLRRSNNHPEVAAKNGLQLVQRQHLKLEDELLALVAAQIALLISGEQPHLVKQCAGADCTLLFLDRTKAHHRLFCSTSACGNRAKVAAFRDRQKTR